MRDLTEADIGRKLGTSPWISFSQNDVDVFGEVTRDIAPLHMDPDWAAENGPYGGPIAYGFQTLSMLSHFVHAILDWPSEEKSPDGVPINYGIERARFLEPVRVGQRLRCHLTLADLTERQDGGRLCRFAVEIEAEGAQRPALTADWLGLWLPTQPA